jgi:hypothetical protein
MQDVEQGRTTAIRRAGNNVADSLVREATDLHGKDTVDLAYWLEARHMAYVHMMLQIQKFIIALVIADKDERDRRSKEANPFQRTYVVKLLMPVKLHYSIETGQRRFTIKELPTSQHRFSEDPGALTDVHRFLRMLLIRPTFAEEPGVTWLELLIAFEIHGCSIEPAVHKRPRQDMARPMRTTRQLLILFKAMVKFVLETCADSLDTWMFRATNINGTRLRTLAIHHAVPSVSFIPIWGNEAAYVITQGLLRQKCRMTKASTHAHEAGTLELPWSNLNLKGAPRWRAAITKGLNDVMRSNLNDAIFPCSNTAVVIDHAAFNMSCPKCLSNRDVSNCSLLVRSGWGHILCLACRLTSRSMTWRCTCDVPWHTCTTHSSIVRVPVDASG